MTDPRFPGAPGDGPDPDLERLLSGAFDAYARAAVPEHRPVPAPAAGPRLDLPHRRRAVWVLAPLAAAAAVIAVVVLALGLTSSGHHTPQAASTPTPSAAAPTPATSATRAQGALDERVASVPADLMTPMPMSSVTASERVHVKTLNSDGSDYGVGMPVVAYFSQRITDARALQAVTSVTVNGKPLSAEWYVETSSAESGYPVEAHLRPKGYWPADSTISVSMPIQGRGAGGGMRFDDSLSLTFTTHASVIATVDAKTHELTVRKDGRQVASYPVSLGANSTPTQRGTKVIMQKGLDISMKGPGYYDPHVQWTQRLTYSGEYLAAAPWNSYNIDHGVDTSDGCVLLHPDDAQRLFTQLAVGDVVRFPDADGPAMKMGQGYGDWNVSWQQWSTGGLAPIF